MVTGDDNNRMMVHSSNLRRWNINCDRFGEIFYDETNGSTAILIKDFGMKILNRRSMSIDHVVNWTLHSRKM